MAVKENGFFRTRSSYQDLSQAESVDQVFKEIVAGKLSKRQALLDNLAEREAGKQARGAE